MKTKFFEVRDSGTCIPVLAIKMIAEASDPVEKQYLWRGGYPPQHPYAVIMMDLNDQKASSDPYDWPADSTMAWAHHYIYDHFDDLTSGQVVDVRTLKDPKIAPAISEIWEG